VANAVAVAMAAYAPALWLVPDPMGRPNDPDVLRWTGEQAAFDDAVYYVERTSDYDAVMGTWSQANSAAGQCGVVTTGLIGDGEIESDDLQRFGAGARLVVLSAYDGDGVLFFEMTRET
jgi:hypothetical protein